jgi:hypothetical protein
VGTADLWHRQTRAISVLKFCMPLLAAMAAASAQAKPAFTGTDFGGVDDCKGGRWSFRLCCFEPEYMGGNHGLEGCVRR